MDTDLPGDISLAVAAFPEFADFAHHIDRSLHPSCNILDQAHDETLVLCRLDHDGWDFLLSEHLKRLKAPLPADQVVSWPARPLPQADCDRPFQADCLDIVHDFAVLPLVAGTGVEHVNP